MLPSDMPLSVTAGVIQCSAEDTTPVPGSEHDGRCMLYGFSLYPLGQNISPVVRQSMVRERRWLERSTWLSQNGLSRSGCCMNLPKVQGDLILRRSFSCCPSQVTTKICAANIC